MLSRIDRKMRIIPVEFSRKENTDMKIGNQIHQLRKLSGMTQEQMAEKLHVSRQTISKWESGNTLPDLESMVRIGRMFQLSLDDLLLKEDEKMTERNEKITLEDLMEIHLHNRRMTLLLVSGLIFLMVSLMGIIFVGVLRSTTLSIEYMLYRYMAAGEYAYAPVNYAGLLIPSVIAGLLGAGLCLWYVIQNRRGRS